MAYEKNPDGSYADLEYTKFPAEIDNWQNSEDVTAEYLSLANDYKSALLAGNYGNAQNILNANPQLKRMIFKADDVNKLKHSMMAVERMFNEEIESYIKSFTDKATSEADKASTSAINASLSEKNALSAKAAAEAKASEADQLVENLKTLKGTLPSDFTEYTQQIAEAKEEFNNTISKHNINKTAHQDIRDALANHTHPVPISTSTNLGCIKVGYGLSVKEDGTLSLMDEISLIAYPVGSIYQSTDATSPAALFGGTWEEIASERVLMGASSTHAAGTTAKAGLPNITGSFPTTTYGSRHNETSGAFSLGSKITSNGENSSQNFNSYYAFFDASGSNAIYGRSSTVQPAAYYVHIWRRTA